MDVADFRKVTVVVDSSEDDLGTVHVIYISKADVPNLKSFIEDLRII